MDSKWVLNKRKINIDLGDEKVVVKISKINEINTNSIAQAFFRIAQFIGRNDDHSCQYIPMRRHFCWLVSR